MTAAKPNLLITGGAGFIGSSFVALAAQNGANVIVLDALTYAGNRANLEGVSHTFVHGNICDRALVAKILHDHAITQVVNFAAESHVDNSISGPAAFIETNITGTFTMLEAAREYWNEQGKPADFRYLQISTDEVYGSLGATGHFTETSPYKPNSPYSASKAGADHLVRAWFETYGLPTLVTHCTNNYGPRQHPEKLIPHMIACALAGKKLPVYGDGKNIRDWIHVEDHCAGIWLALTQGKPGEAYDFGGRAEVENLTLVKSICALLDSKRPKSSSPLPLRGRVGGGAEVENNSHHSNISAPLLTSPLMGEGYRSYADQIAFVTDRLGHDRRYAIDDSKSERELGYTRKYKLEQGLEATLDWYLNNEKWCNIITGAK